MSPRTVATKRSRNSVARVYRNLAPRPTPAVCPAEAGAATRPIGPRMQRPPNTVVTPLPSRRSRDRAAPTVVPEVAPATEVTPAAPAAPDALDFDDAFTALDGFELPEFSVPVDASVPIVLDPAESFAAPDCFDFSNFSVDSSGPSLDDFEFPEVPVAPSDPAALEDFAALEFFDLADFPIVPIDISPPVTPFLLDPHDIPVADDTLTGILLSFEQYARLGLHVDVYVDLLDRVDHVFATELDTDPPGCLAEMQTALSDLAARCSRAQRGGQHLAMLGGWRPEEAVLQWTGKRSEAAADDQPPAGARPEPGVSGKEEVNRFFVKVLDTDSAMYRLLVSPGELSLCETVHDLLKDVNREGPNEEELRRLVMTMAEILKDKATYLME